MNKYYEGWPCIRGHGRLRYASTRRCVTCELERHREWIAKNPEKSKQYHKKYRQTHKEAINEYNKERRKIIREKELVTD
jgi:hypothetical protein